MIIQSCQHRHPNFLLWLIVAALGLYCSSSTLQAQSGTRRGAIAILHQPPSVKELPYPGQTLELSAKLTNTRSTEGQMLVALVKDGRNMQILARPGYLNERDQPTYEFEFPSPTTEVDYQLLLQLPDGSVVASPKYAMRRSCIPNVQLAPSEISQDAQGSERLRQLVVQMNQLGDDLRSYDKALQLLQRLKELTK